MENNRNQIIDFFRGIAISDMIIVHFSDYFSLPISKIISYTDIAIEGFILLTGFMIGHHYYPKYIQDGNKVTRRLLNRVFQIIAVQYILILTINLPFYYILHNEIHQTEPVSIFLIKSMFFLNQIGLIHILPTFIPLFLISPILLYAFSRNYSHLVLFASICLFAIGNKYPYIIDIGDKTIFPFILWQIYFVAGIYLGIKAYTYKKIGPEHIKKYLYASIILFLATMLVKHAKIIPPALTSKFPLNALGLLYGTSILFIIYTFTLKYWNVFLNRIKIFYYYIPLLGRHSLLTFVLHVYTAKSILLINQFFNVNIYLNYFFILLSIIFIYAIIYLYDAKQINLYYALPRKYFNAK